MPTSLQSFFDYGRSVEAKVIRILGTSDATAARIASAGWRTPPLGPGIPTQPRPGSDLLLAEYGMSFNQQICSALAELDPKVTLRSWGGPSASPNCAYGYYLADRGRHKADVVLLGILSNRVAAMESNSGMNSLFEAPAPYTYPIFLPDGSGGLSSIEPSIHTTGQLRAALADPVRRDELRQEMQRYDAYFTPFLFDHDLFDSSALVRVIRRALAHHHQRIVESRTTTEAGFVADSPAIVALNRIVKEFAASARQDRMVPVVLLIHTRGSSDHLFKALAGTLAAHDIPFVSSHTICSANDSTNYVSDGHFTAENNRRIAQELADVIARRIPGRRRSTIPEPKPGE